LTGRRSGFAGSLGDTLDIVGNIEGAAGGGPDAFRLYSRSA
jgi:hypothetical protein